MTNEFISRPIAAQRRLAELTDHTPDCDTDPYRASDAHDAANELARDLLIFDDDETLTLEDDIDNYRRDYAFDPTIDIDAIAAELIDIFAILRSDPFSIHFLSQLRLDHSICPMHHCDYMMCFEDDDPDCATIRAYFPSHDT